MADLIGEVIGEAFKFAVVLTGNLVVRVTTFGLWRGERLNSDEGRIDGPAGALSFKHEGQRVVTDTGCLLVGILFYALFALSLLWLVS